MVQLADKRHCTGCSACAQICTHQAIQMLPDDEGFLYPNINAEKCVECGLCMQCCPELHSIDKLNYSRQKVFAVINYDDCQKSSSGGAFSVFAKWILNQGGIVFGATIDDKFAVKHIGIDTIKDLDKLRGSKYVQSIIGDTYKQVKVCLKKGQKILFTGTGCQIAGLYAFLKGKRYENQLITLDLVCHGVPSQKVFSSYLDKLQKAMNQNIDEFQFRKLDSWSIIPAVRFTKSKWYLLDLWENAYMNAFFKGIIYRESCFNCQYCNMQRIGTCSIADFWGIGKHGNPFSKNISSGVSLVIDNIGIIEQIKDGLIKNIYIEERDVKEAIAEQVNLKHPMQRQPEREYAIKLLLDKNVSLKDFSKECGLIHKPTLNWIIKKTLKDLVCLLGLYNVYKSLIYKIKR